MLKFLASVFILLSFVSCGVDTSSSTQTAKVEETTGTGTDTLTPPPLVELNPIADANGTVPDDGTIDPDDGTDPNDGIVPTNDANQEDSTFDITGAIEDEFACFLGDVNDGYTNNVIVDDSYDYAGSFSDEEDGVGINSGLPYYNNVELTEVHLFYYDLKPVRAFNKISIFEDKYTMYIDEAWSINDMTAVYVRTPRDTNGLYACYRYELADISIDNIPVRKKVYRITKE